MKDPKQQARKEETGKENPPDHLSDKIENAHSAGDGSLGRGKDSLLVPDEEKEIEKDSETPKAPEPY